MTHGTDPLDADSDDDGLTDGAEVVTHGTDPLDADSDDDGLTDGAEVVTHGTDPLDADSDDDGMPDGWEVSNGLDPLADDAGGDPDGDGLSNLQEYTHGTDPLDVDTDGDGLSDGDEVNVYGTDPLDTDTDDDGLTDGWEIAYFGDDTLYAGEDDPDGDGYDNASEHAWGTNPADGWTFGDSDSLPDEWEFGCFGGLTQHDTTDYDDDRILDVDEFGQGTDPTSASDSDADNMADDWELWFFGNITSHDGTADSDGDALADAEEYLLGLDPLSLDSQDDGYVDGQSAGPRGGNRFYLGWFIAANYPLQLRPNGTFVERRVSVTKEEGAGFWLSGVQTGKADWCVGHITYVNGSGWLTHNDPARYTPPTDVSNLIPDGKSRVVFKLVSDHTNIVSGIQGEVYFVTEVRLDLYKPGLAEEDEEYPGAFVCWNDPDEPDPDKLVPVYIGFPKIHEIGTITLRRDSSRINVWKSRDRGAGNEILVDDDSVSWDLSDPSERAEFHAVQHSLWVEGVETGEGFLTVEHSSAPDAEDKIKFTILCVDMEIYKPKVVDPAEPMIPDADELSKGSVTFVNLDNDDNDSKFDHGGASTDDEVTGGDDELVKVKLKLKPSSLTQGRVRLLATAGAGNIAVWTNDNKAAASAYALGTALNVPGDFTVEGDSLVKTMWVEGISAHTAQQGTKLKMEYTISGTTCEDEVALTVVGVDRITWKGKGNSLNDDDTLDADPNWPGGLTPNGLRVFPGARAVSGLVEANPRDKVIAEVMLTVEPPHQIKLYLESFDTDDPTADTSPVDDEANEEDNRGTSPAKAGQFTGESGGVLELVFPENVKTTNCEFRVTMQPGDNFRIVANGDKDFLSRLENKDSVSGASNADKQRICNKDVTGTPAEREVRLAAHYASDTLVVWRFLHIEVDSMAAPPATGAEKNTAHGNLTGVVGNGMVAQRVNLNINLKTGFTPQDNSDNLTTGTDNGRFENGWIKIGSGGGTPGQTETSALLGNGDDYVRKDAGIDIPALVSKAGQSDVSGNVIAWSGSAFTLSVSSGTLSTNYNGGSLNVAGVSATITTVSGTNVVNVTAAPTIPFVLHDDDDDTVLPGTVALWNLQESDDPTANRMAPLFVRPVYDGGGSLGNNETNVSFVRNTESSTVYSWGSRANNSPRFWVVYFLAAFQDSYLMLTKDFDPAGEGGTWASANNWPLGSGVLFYLESFRDGSLAADWIARVTVHELGHNFGLLDSYVSPATDGIMHGYAPAGSASANFFWRDADVNTIRSVSNPN